MQWGQSQPCWLNTCQPGTNSGVWGSSHHRENVIDGIDVANPFQKCNDAKYKFTNLAVQFSITHLKG